MTYTDEPYAMKHTTRPQSANDFLHHARDSRKAWLKGAALNMPHNFSRQGKLDVGSI